MDKADDAKCRVVSSPCLRNSIYDQFHCHLLSCLKSHPICHNGELRNLIHLQINKSIVLIKFVGT